MVTPMAKALSKETQNEISTMCALKPHASLTSVSLNEQLDTSHVKKDLHDDSLVDKSLELDMDFP